MFRESEGPAFQTRMEPDMSLNPTLNITSAVTHNSGYMATDLVRLVDGLPGRVWLVVDPYSPQWSEYYVEVFNKETLSWNQLYRIQGTAVKDMPLDPTPRAIERLQELGEELLLMANTILTAATPDENN